MGTPILSEYHHSNNPKPDNRINTFPRKFDNVLDDVQAILMSFLVKLGPFCVALMPALFTAYAIFHTFNDEAGTKVALFFAVVVGFAMETVGIVATHTAIDLYNAKEEDVIQPIKFRLMFWLVPVYVIGVSSVVGFSEDAFTPLVKGLGVSSPFLTCIVYIAVALARDLSNLEAKRSITDERQAVIEDEQRRWQREKERFEMELKHKEKLARIEAKHVKSAIVQSVNNTGTSVQNDVNFDAFDGVNLSKEEKKNRLLDSLVDIYLENPTAGVSVVARMLNVSRQTIYNYLNELEQNGRISRNGQGVEVLAR